MTTSGTNRIRLFLAGDVMLGRGVDQVLPHPGNPVLYEDYVKSAGDYVRLAEEANGPIPRNRGFDYPWGEALAELDHRAPDLRIVNLETTITDSEMPADKGINYRMSPRNVGAISVAGIDACMLANNHMLDWQAPGLTQTLYTLDAAGLRHAGAGRTARDAEAPLIFDLPGGRRIHLISIGTESSGCPLAWAAGPDRPGIVVARGAAEAIALARQAFEGKGRGDTAIVSVHWGSNWDYATPKWQRALARRWIDEAGADIIHGHSSHHPKGIEVYSGRLILYGCGDLINDYEGIRTSPEYRGDLVLMYFADLAADGSLERLDMVPMRMRRLRLESAGRADAEWLRDRLNEKSMSPGTELALETGGVPSISLRAVRSTPADTSSPLSSSVATTENSPVGCSTDSVFGLPSGIFAIRAAGPDFSMQAVPTLTAPSTPIALWQRCGMKVRVETQPPFFAGLTIVIFGTDFSLTSPRFIIGPPSGGSPPAWRAMRRWLPVLPASRRR
jgi:poly-gamma-glutamate capsule biosynthesis protein CapA/YwtB (metallophosphatase superfamily)